MHFACHAVQAVSVELGLELLWFCSSPLASLHNFAGHNDATNIPVG